jgi:hypothetical protein
LPEKDTIQSESADDADIDVIFCDDVANILMLARILLKNQEDDEKPPEEIAIPDMLSLCCCCCRSASNSSGWMAKNDGAMVDYCNSVATRHRTLVGVRAFLTFWITYHRGRQTVQVAALSRPHIINEINFISLFDKAAMVVCFSPPF